MEMRTRIIVMMGALLLVFAGFAQAQPTTLMPLDPEVGQVDFGARLTDTSGDPARYQRFRDLRDGATLNLFRFERERTNWLFSASAFDVGYRDQRYIAGFERFGIVKASFEWDQIPTFYSTDTRVLHANAGGGVFRVDDTVQQSIQGQRMTLSEAVSGLPTFDLRNQRDVAAFDILYSVSPAVDLKFDVQSTRRDGAMMYNGMLSSPGSGYVYELPAPLDDRTTDVALNVELEGGDWGLLSLGYDGSWFDNDIPSIRWDNTVRFSDAVGSPSQGQMAWWPSNVAHTVNAKGSLKLPARSRASAMISFGTWSQDADLLPSTVNTALLAPVVERATAQAEAQIMAMNYAFTSRPSKFLWFDTRYRFYDYENRTRHFAISNMVYSDQSLGAAVENEPGGYSKHDFSADAAFSPISQASLKVGYARNESHRTFRIFETTTEDVFRASIDSVGNAYFSVRAIYEFSTRVGSEFEEHLLEEVGEQPEMRHYDIANRDRNRVTALVTLTPVSALGISFSVGSGQDDYEDTGFGMRDNEHRVYNVGFDLVPGDKVDVGANVGYEKYTAFQYSRTSNPLPSPTFNDPTRDWTTDTTDELHTANATLGLIKLVPKTDLRFDYDWSRGEATYVYGIMPNATIPVPAPLPSVKNELQTARGEVRYFLRSDVAIGAVYMYEDYDVDDFSFSPDTINRVDLGTTTYLGYVYRPYTAHTAWLKITYLW
jgi:MtrB/PioB family decaheme-associated outer membrane protein